MNDEPKPYSLLTSQEGVRVRFKVGVEVRLVASKVNRRWQVHPPFGVTIAPSIWHPIAAEALKRYVTEIHPEDRETRAK